MKKIEKDEQIKIVGGSITYSATFINAICRVVDILFDVGQNLGSAIRRSIEKESCSLK